MGHYEHVTFLYATLLQLNWCPFYIYQRKIFPVFVYSLLEKKKMKLVQGASQTNFQSRFWMFIFCRGEWDTINMFYMNQFNEFQFYGSWCLNASFSENKCAHSYFIFSNTKHTLNFNWFIAQVLYKLMFTTKIEQKTCPGKFTLTVVRKLKNHHNMWQEMNVGWLMVNVCS